jgi:hypothetical protein
MGIFFFLKELLRWESRSKNEGSMKEIDVSILDHLVRQDIALGAEIAKVERARDIQLTALARQSREVGAAFEKELAPLKEQRGRIRGAILDAWPAGGMTLDLPSAKVSRRNYRDLTVHDRTALLYALDRIDRLDLVEFVFDGPEVAALIAAGRLPDLPVSAVSVLDHYNLQVRPKDGPGANVGGQGASGVD